MSVHIFYFFLFAFEMYELCMKRIYALRSALSIYSKWFSLLLMPLLLLLSDTLIFIYIFGRVVLLVAVSCDHYRCTRLYVHRAPHHRWSKSCQAPNTHKREWPKLIFRFAWIVRECQYDGEGAIESVWYVHRAAATTHIANAAATVCAKCTRHRRALILPAAKFYVAHTHSIPECISVSVALHWHLLVNKWEYDCSLEQIKLHVCVKSSCIDAARAAVCADVLVLQSHKET